MKKYDLRNQENNNILYLFIKTSTCRSNITQRNLLDQHDLEISLGEIPKKRYTIVN